LLVHRIGSLMIHLHCVSGSHSACVADSQELSSSHFRSPSSSCAFGSSQDTGSSWTVSVDLGINRDLVTLLYLSGCSNGHGAVRCIYRSGAAAESESVDSAADRTADLRRLLGVFLLVHLQHQCHGQSKSTNTQQQK